MIYWKLFLSFLQIGLLSIGGGYAAIPLIQDQVVVRHDWLTLSEFADLVTIAEMTPGPIAVNAATFVGIRVAGLAGALLATLGSILPGCCIVLVLSVMYRKYGRSHGLQTVLVTLRPATVALIAGAALSIIAGALGAVQGMAGMHFAAFPWVKLAIILAGFVLLRTKKPSPILTIFASGGLWLLWQLACGAVTL